MSAFTEVAIWVLCFALSYSAFTIADKYEPTKVEITIPPIVVTNTIERVVNVPTYQGFMPMGPYTGPIYTNLLQTIP